MNAKEKNILIKSKKILYILISIFIILMLLILYDKFFPKNEAYAKETSTGDVEMPISEAEKINIDNVINQNLQSTKKEELVVEKVQLEYITKYNTNSNLPKGIVQVIQEGREGTQEITKKIIYENEKIISEEQISVKITKAAINKIVEIGSGAYTNTYKIKRGDIIYITSDRCSIYAEPNIDSKKILTLNKNDEVEVLEVQNEWYKISSNSTIGYLKSENTTYIKPGEKQEIDNEQQQSSNITEKLSFNMNLNNPSGLTIEQFKKVLTDDKDKNKIFENNSQYFYYIEKQYNINGVFVAAVGIHESAWGTSKIAMNKKNLFGYGAYDSNPYNGAYSFSDYSECIDLIARVFVKYYLNPKGTEIYNGEKAIGTYYYGSTLKGINTKYATDKNWANSVYKHIEYLYNKLSG